MTLPARNNIKFLFVLLLLLLVFVMLCPDDDMHGRGSKTAHTGERILKKRISMAGAANSMATEGAMEPYMQWHVFQGGSGYDIAKGLAIDRSGNIYITGTSSSSWGSPINPHSGNNDVFVAKLNASGTLQWSTFLGGGAQYFVNRIAVDELGNSYVAGTSASLLGSGTSGFIAGISADGDLLWRTSIGKSAQKIIVGNNGNIYGMFFMGNEEHYYHRYSLLRIIKFDSSGKGLNLVDYLTKGYLESMYVDGSGNLFLTGYAAYSTDSDIDCVIDAYDANGTYIYNNTINDSWDTSGNDIIGDRGGNIYFTGGSDSLYWSNSLTPKRPYGGGNDAFIAKLAKYPPFKDLELKWYGFLGGSGYDSGSAIAMDDKMNSFVAGSSESTWEDPWRPYSGGKDAFVACINENGKLLWNAFLGGGRNDTGDGIAVDGQGDIVVLGTSNSSWGRPRAAFRGGSDVFLVKLRNGTIIPKSITLVSPKGGEEWTVGTIHDITWKSTGKVAKVRIEVSVDNASTWSDVAVATANNGSFFWTVPYSPSRHCRVRISDVADSAISDTSDATFAIVAYSLEMSAERREVRAFSIVRQYGQIQFTAENSNGQVARYSLLRRQGTGEFVLLKEITSSELQDNRFQLQDRYLEKDTNYTYVVEAYNEAGQVVGRSAEKTI